MIRNDVLSNGEPIGSGSLTWLDDLGLGYCDSKPMEYGQNYWQEYIDRAASPMGVKLTEIRTELVAKYLPSSAFLLDVGIGCGQFVEARPNTFGTDLNPRAVAWLQERAIFVPDLHGWNKSMTFWDSLEHIPRASDAFVRASEFAFLTMPIYRDRDHVLRSKHFKPGEHLWYWTRAGLIRWARGLGYECLEVNDLESRAGREDIETFVFCRRP